MDGSKGLTLVLSENDRETIYDYMWVDEAGNRLIRGIPKKIFNWHSKHINYLDVTRLPVLNLICINSISFFTIWSNFNLMLACFKEPVRVSSLRFLLPNGEGKYEMLKYLESIVSTILFEYIICESIEYHFPCLQSSDDSTLKSSEFPVTTKESSESTVTTKLSEFTVTTRMSLETKSLTFGRIPADVIKIETTRPYLKLSLEKIKLIGVSPPSSIMINRIRISEWGNRTDKIELDCNGVKTKLSQYYSGMFLKNGIPILVIDLTIPSDSTIESKTIEDSYSIEKQSNRVAESKTIEDPYSIEKQSNRAIESKTIEDPYSIQERSDPGKDFSIKKRSNRVIESKTKEDPHSIQERSNRAIKLKTREVSDTACCSQQ
jgi:hypothetical protein